MTSLSSPSKAKLSVTAQKKILLMIHKRHTITLANNDHSCAYSVPIYWLSKGIPGRRAHLRLLKSETDVTHPQNTVSGGIGGLLEQISGRYEQLDPQYSAGHAPGVTGARLSSVV
jgi:hypothetical protein